MNQLLGKKVVVRELFFGRAVRDKQPAEVAWKGVLREISGHMICLDVQELIDPGYSYPHARTRWFNTMASTFIAIDA